MQWWKWLGLAGLAGVAASGAVVKRDQRQRKAYSPDEMRARIHERAEDALASEVEAPQAGADEG